MSDCYAARKACGCLVAAIVIDGTPRKDLAREVARWIRDGLEVERMDVERVREQFRRCRCKQEAEQLSLPEET